MTYVIDTDWAADYLKGKPAAVAKIDPYFADGLAISIITYAELYEGIYYGTNRPYYEAGLRRFLRGIDVLNLNRAIARRFAVVRGQLRAEGQLIIRGRRAGLAAIFGWNARLAASVARNPPGCNPPGAPAWQRTPGPG